jgi:hypothetical protein
MELSDPFCAILLVPEFSHGGSGIRACDLSRQCQRPDIMQSVAWSSSFEQSGDERMTNETAFPKNGILIGIQ